MIKKISKRIIKNIKKAPKEIMLCNLEVIVMPNGEILCLGKNIGWVQELGKHLTEKL